MEMHLPKITIELLTEEDSEWAARVAGVRMLEEEVGRPELVDGDSLDIIIATCMSTQSIFVAKVDGECAGMIGGFLGPNMFNPKYNLLTELVWYVLPKYRKTRVGMLLLKAFMELGEEVADETTLCLLYTSPVRVSTLEKKGFTLREFAFSKQNKE